MNRKALLTHVGATLSASGIVLVSIAAANILIGRMLGVEGQGRLAAATLVPVIVGYAGEFGIPVATGYLINVESGRRLATIATARLISVAVSALLTALSALLVLTLPIPIEARWLSLAFCPFIAINMFYRLHLMILQADMRLRTFNRVRIAGAISYLLILVSYAITGVGTPFRVILALLAANMVWLILSLYLTSSDRPWFALDRTAAKSVLRYGLRAHIGNVSSVDGLRLDQLVLALLLDTRQLGLYVAAMTLIIGNRLVGTSIGALCFPIASRANRGQDPSARRQFRFLLAGSLLLSCALAAVESILGDWLMATLFGPAFKPAGQALAVLAVASIFMNARQVCADWLRGCGRPTIVTVSELVGMVVLAIVAAVLWDGTVTAVAWSVSVASAAALCVLAVGAQLSSGTRPAPASPQPLIGVVHGTPT